MALDWCERVAGVAQEFGYRFRFKLRSEIKAEPWGRWLICPTGRYLENDASGPYSVRELEWVEVAPGGAGVGALIEAFTAVGVPAAVAHRSVRLQAPDAEPGAAADGGGM